MAFSTLNTRCEGFSFLDFTDSEGVERTSLQVFASEVEADSLYRKTSEQ